MGDLEKEVCKRYVVDCAGQRIAVDQETYIKRCAIGNTDDFLSAFKKYVNAKLLSFGEPAPVNIVVPSYKSDFKIYGTLLSLLSQNYKQNVEIVIFVNEPPDVSDEGKAANDRTIAFLENLVQGKVQTVVRQDRQHRDLVKHVFELAKKKQESVKLRYVRETVDGGLAEVYQIAIVSHVARLRKFCDSVTTDRAARLKCISRRLFGIFLMFCDDDMEFVGNDLIQRAFEYAIENNAIVLGKIDVEQVQTRREMGEINSLLKDIMQVFLDFKHDGGLNFLAPRGMLLANALVGGRICIGQPFADQLYFANLAVGRFRYFVNVRTGINESNCPGNGLFLRDLADYLSGKNNDAVKVFENVLERYKEKNHWGKFCVSDVKNFVGLLRKRDIKQLSRAAQELLSR